MYAVAFLQRPAITVPVSSMWSDVEAEELGGLTELKAACSEEFRC